MKILIITSEFPPRPGGIGNHSYGLFLSLKQAGDEVRVLSNSRDKALERIWLTKNGLEEQVYYVPRIHPPLFTYIKRCHEAYKQLHHLYRHEKEAAIIYSGKFSLWMMGVLPLSKRVKALAVVHGSEIQQNALGAWLFRRAFQRADAVVSVSAYTQQKLLERYQIPSNKCRVINNGFLPPSSMNQSKANNSHVPGLCNLITVGNLSRRKGQFNVVRALPEILKRLPSLQYEIIGIPTEAQVLKAEIKQLELEPRVHIRGAVNEAQKWEFLSKASIFMMLSEELPNGDFEGFGIAILEANYMGLPAIGSKNSGIADAINHGYSGLLVDPHNIREIAEAINSIMKDYDTFSTKAKLHASKYLWDKKVGEYLLLFE